MMCLRGNALGNCGGLTTYKAIRISHGSPQPSTRACLATHWQHGARSADSEGPHVSTEGPGTAATQSSFTVHDIDRPHPPPNSHMLTQCCHSILSPPSPIPPPMRLQMHSGNGSRAEDSSAEHRDDDEDDEFSVKAAISITKRF